MEVEMSDVLITIFTIVAGGISTAVAMLWKFVQSRFEVQDRLLQECEAKHARSENKYDSQISKIVEMSENVGELRAQVDSLRGRQDRTAGKLEHIEQRHIIEDK